jgi:hypothetical protein
MLSFLLVALAVSAPGQSPASVEVGRFRQVQIMAPGADDALRIATVGLIAPLDDGGKWSATRIKSSFVEVRSMGADWGIPEARVELSFNPIRQYSWTRRPTWRVVEFDGLLLLAYLGPGRSARLHVIDMTTGQRLADSVQGDEIYDARTVGERSELLVRHGATVARVVVSNDAGSVTLRSIPLTTTVDGVALESVSAATFAVGATSRCEPTGDAWILGLVDDVPRLVHVPADAAASTSAFDVEVRALEARDDSVYLAAASATGRTWIAIGQQAFSSGHGLVTVFIRAAREEPKQLWSTVGPDTFAALDWGHDLIFVPDADGDDFPDLVVPGPWAVGATSWIDLVSTATGAGITRWDPGLDGPAVGFTADLSRDGKRIVVGGTTRQYYPEMFLGRGVVTVLDARTLKPLSWKLETLLR